MVCSFLVKNKESELLTYLVLEYQLTPDEQNN